MKFRHGKNFCIKDKRTVYIDKTVKIGDNVIIYENNRIEGSSVIEDGAVILPGCYIVDTVVGKNSIVNHSQCDKAVIGCGCSVGPFARLRPNAVLASEVKISLK